MLQQKIKEVITQQQIEMADSQKEALQKKIQEVSSEHPNIEEDISKKLNKDLDQPAS